MATKATVALKNSIPLIAKDDGEEQSHGGFETSTTHTARDMVRTQKTHQRVQAAHLKNTRTCTHDFLIGSNLRAGVD